MLAFLKKKPHFKLDEISSAAIEVTLMALFFLVPLIVIPATSELFEFNKIYLTYALASLLLFLELVRLIASPKPLLFVPPLWQAGLIFLGALALSTVFSIDQHVSFFGFYDRWNGGLLSWIAYFAVFFSLTQLSPKSFLTMIKVSLLAGVIASVWGILEHNGIDASYWVQNVRARVFSTLGQPNWLAAYLAMLLPWLLSFYITAKNKFVIPGLYAAGLIIFTCFIFTYSRGGDFGLTAALVVWLVLIGLTSVKRSWPKLALVGAGFLIIATIFASPLTNSIFKSPPTRTIGTLEQGDETGNIRLIVWQGALEIFKHYPVLGSGVETFGESFYQFRPLAMNQTTEWNFLFNKAHNEYLNYLATTGLAGTAAYLFLIGSFIWQALKLYRQDPESRIWVAAAAASTAGYLVQNIFSFTVTPLALLFILNLAVLIFSKRRPVSWSWPGLLGSPPIRWFGLILALPLIYILSLILNIWQADIYYAQGAGENSLGDNLAAQRDLQKAVSLNPTEPIYLAELGFAEAALAESYSPDSSGDLADQAAQDIALTTKISPHLLSLWEINAQSYEHLISLDQKYVALAESAHQKATILDPTDPEVWLNLGNFYSSQKKDALAIDNFLKAVSLKPDYFAGLIALTNKYISQGNTAQAKMYLDRARQVDPNNPALPALTQKVSP